MNFNKILYFECGLASRVQWLNENLKLKPITVPLHKYLKPGLLHRILKDVNLTIEDFIKL